jgi:hypothetical protein
MVDGYMPDGGGRPGSGIVPMKSPIVAIFLFLLASSPAGSYQERLIVSANTEACALRVEADEESRTVRLRVQSDRPGCDVDREAVQRILKTAFSKTDDPRLEGPYSSLFLGRLIDYPWLSRYLADTAYNDRRWNRLKGKAVSGNAYAYVASVLSRPDVTSGIDSAIGESGYRIVSATVEKVLIGSLRNVPLYRGKDLPGKVPIDCMVWFRLQKDE